MSWDFSMCVDVGIDGEKKYVSVGDFDANYTYNVSGMFYDAFPDRKGIRDSLSLRPGHECAPLLDAAIEAMTSDRAKYEAMNPPNGWGDYDGALNLLRTLRSWCDEAPNALMEVR